MSFTATEEQYALINRAAKAKGVSVSEFVRSAAESACNRVMAARKRATAKKEGK